MGMLTSLTNTGGGGEGEGIKRNSITEASVKRSEVDVEVDVEE